MGTVVMLTPPRPQHHSICMRQPSPAQSASPPLGPQSMAAAGHLVKTSVSPHSDHPPLTIRLLMQGKEVGSIIGKKGDIVKRFREESGAKINITDGACPERIVTVTGTNSSILKAFTLICAKFEEDLESLVTSPGIPKPPITLRLIIPASQCGSLIGKGGSKIKEVREVTGASVQVASEMLPNSTERAVTISGNSEAITQCIYNICNIMAESPPREGCLTVPYRPQSQHRPVPVYYPPHHQQPLLPAVAGPQLVVPPVQYTQMGKGGLVPHGPAGGGLTNINGLNGLTGFGPGVLSPAALAALAGGGGRGGSTHQTHEMTVPNEIIGCVIGKGGSKIAEIRQISGAMIRISNCEDRDAPANLDRTITISGNCESVALAQYLINMRISMETASLGGLAGFQYLSPNHIIKSPVH